MGEKTGLADHDRVAGLEQVDEGRFHAAAAGRRQHECCFVLCLEDLPQQARRLLQKT